MKFLCFATLICLSQIIQYSFACKGYGVKLQEYSNHDDKQPIIIERGASARLDDDCKLYVKGCIVFKQSIYSAKLSVVAKNNRKSEIMGKKNIDLCDILEESGYPHKCPLKISKPTRICDNGKHPIDLRKYRDYVKVLEGDLHVTAKVATTMTKGGRGRKSSVFKLKLKIFKK